MKLKISGIADNAGKLTLFGTTPFSDYMKTNGRTAIGEATDSVYLGDFPVDRSILKIGSTINVLYEAARQTKDGRAFSPIAN